eukprot:11029953-Ditylum_brightwellii.AAC.1
MSRIIWLSSNFLWYFGYLPQRFREGLDLLIHKKPNSNQSHWLRPILLFDIKANMHSKCIGRYAMQLAEVNGGIAQEQDGSKKHHAADIQVLNTRLFYDMVRLEHTPASQYTAPSQLFKIWCTPVTLSLVTPTAHMGVKYGQYHYSPPTGIGTREWNQPENMYV